MQKSFYKLFVIVVFFIYLFSGAIGVIKGVNASSFSQTEQREPTLFPAFFSDTKAPSPSHFTNELQKYLEDRFLLREKYLELLFKVWNISPTFFDTQAQYIRGKDNWLFLKGGISYSNMQKFNKNNKIMFIEQIYKLCQNNNIIFIVLIGPDKHNVYPEFLPDYVREEINFTYFATHISRQIKDNTFSCLYPDFKTVKLNMEQGKLYFKDDSHWNGYGAGVAFSMLIEELESKNIKFNNPPQMILRVREKQYGGDLINMSKLPLINYRDDQYWYFDYKGRENVEQIIAKVKEFKHVFKNKGAHSNKKIVLLGDSFTDELMPLLYPYFSEIHRLHRGYYNINDIGQIENYIKLASPDIFIYETVERDF